MFGSRKRRAPPYPLLTAATANPKAATAAVAVFKRPESNSSLSAAAAAAALGARPTSPTNVGAVQTKRSLRRCASTSSNTSDARGRSALQRRGSSSSMSERTFRSPSPHRSNSAQGVKQMHGRSHETPPVPALRQDLVTFDIRAGSSGTGPRRQRRKTPSLGISAAPMRVASQKLDKDQASWFGAAKVGDTSNVRRLDPAMASPPSSPPQLVQEEPSPEKERPGSRASVNFSYPTRLRVGSPPLSPVERKRLDASAEKTTRRESRARRSRSDEQLNDRVLSNSATSARRRPASMFCSADCELVYDPNTRRLMPKVEALEAELSITEASAKPTRARKNKQAPTNVGLHLSQKTMDPNQQHVQDVKPQRDARSSVAHPRAQLRPEARPNPVSASSQGKTSAINDHALPLELDLKRPNQPSHPQAANPSPMKLNMQDVNELAAFMPRDLAGQVLTVKRQPSIAKEVQEPKSDGDQFVARQAVGTCCTRHQSSPVGVVPPGKVKLNGDAASGSPPPRPPSSFGETSASPRSRVSDDQKTVSFQPRAIHDGSPARQAHFGPTQSKPIVKHSPPPRSVSPQKSALKLKSPDRGSDDTSECSWAAAEAVLSRKKSVRVSFDDEHMVVGEAASTGDLHSPVPINAQKSVDRQPWHSNFTRSKKRYHVPLAGDVVMKPRPVLPSFGSVRDKKPRDQSATGEERPLVRPIVERNSSAATAQAEDDLDDVRDEFPRLDQSSSGQAIGQGLANCSEQASRNEVNTSRLRELFPSPVVALVESGGYLSDSGSSQHSEQEKMGSPCHAEQDLPRLPERTEPEPAKQPLNGPARMAEAANKDDKGKQVENNIPTIAVTPSSPGVEIKAQPWRFRLDLPGGFPDDGSDGFATESSSVKETGTAVRMTVMEPTARAEDAETIRHGPATVSSSSRPTFNGSDDESDSSVYSDACEDVSDVAGSGFQSLDAVIEGPVGSKASRLPAQSAHDGDKEKAPPGVQNGISTAVVAVQTQSAEKSADDVDWETAKAYWRSLTAEKRAQLEREAFDEAGVEGDGVEVRRPSAKPRRKKPVEKRAEERKALATHLAQLVIAQQSQKDRTSRNERACIGQSAATWVDDQGLGPKFPPSSMRSTMRGQRQSQEPAARDRGLHLRATMRSGGTTTTRLYPVRPATRSKPAEGLKSFPPGEAATPASAQMPPRLVRRDSGGSESSFKRSRFASSSLGFGICGWSRPSSLPPTQTHKEDKGANRFTLRTWSPTRVSSPFLRPGSADTVLMSDASGMTKKRTLRASSQESDRKAHRASFGLAAKMARKGNIPTSRFGESSDEDEGTVRPSEFRSRFDDSSDDDPVPNVSAAASTTFPSSMRASKAAAVPRAPTGLKQASAPTTVPAPAQLPGQARPRSSMARTALTEEEDQSNKLADHADGCLAAADFHKPRNPNLVSAALMNAGLGRSRSGRGSMVPARQSEPAAGTVTGTTSTAYASATSPTGSPSARPNPKRNSLVAVLWRRGGGTKDASSAAKITCPGLTETAARPDTRLERNAEEVGAVSASTSLPSSSKLRKRMASLDSSPAIMWTDWPLQGQQNALDQEVADQQARQDQILALARAQWAAATAAGSGYGTGAGPAGIHGDGSLGTRSIGGGGGGGPRPDWLLPGLGTLPTRSMSESEAVGGLGKGYCEAPASGCILDSWRGRGDDDELVSMTVMPSMQRKKKFGVLRRMFRLDG